MREIEKQLIHERALCIAKREESVRLHKIVVWINKIAIVTNIIVAAKYAASGQLFWTSVFALLILTNWHLLVASDKEQKELLEKYDTLIREYTEAITIYNSLDPSTTKQMEGDV